MMPTLAQRVCESTTVRAVSDRSASRSRSSARIWARSARGVVAELADLGRGLVHEREVAVGDAHRARREQRIGRTSRDQARDVGVGEVEIVPGHEHVQAGGVTAAHLEPVERGERDLDRVVTAPSAPRAERARGRRGPRWRGPSRAGPTGAPTPRPCTRPAPRCAPRCRRRPRSRRRPRCRGRASIADEPLGELGGPVLERGRGNRIGDQRARTQRAPQGPGDRLHRGRGRAQHARVAVGIAHRPGRASDRVELGQEGRQLGRRAFGGRRTTATIPHIGMPV